VLVLVDALADAVLLPVDPFLFRLGQVAIVSSHIFLLTALHVGFAFLQIGGLFRAQRAALDAVGNAILLTGLATVYLIHPGMARIDRARSSA